MSNLFRRRLVAAKRKFDYVVVGAGSAGCVLANRLSQDPSKSVLLLEAGPSDRFLGLRWPVFSIHMPSALSFNLRPTSKFNWAYETVPQRHCRNRRFVWPRGKCLGGSSSLNAMVYVRGHPADFENWAKLTGDSKFGYSQMLAYFKRAQCHELGGDLYRGDQGPLKVSQGEMPSPLYQAFLDAGEQAGYKRSDDLNGYQFEGFGPFDRTINKEDGTRWNTASAYLIPAKQRANLTVKTGSLVEKVLLRGSKCFGVRVNSYNGTDQEDIEADEVILSGGAINSPQILELSGIGDHDKLRKIDGIELTHHIDQVGEHLQDHLEVSLQQECTQPVSLYKAQQWWYMPKIGIQWFLTGRGLCASSHFDCGAFIKSDNSVDYADIQFHFVPTQYNDHGQSPPDREAYQIHIGSARQASLGSVHVKSSDPRVHPAIDPNYLSAPGDLPHLVKCIKLGRELFAQAAFDEFRSDEYLPGSHIQSDAEIESWVLDNCNTNYHPCSSLRIGPVLDNDFRVLGLDGLRVVDASSFPFIPSGNLNAPVIALAELAADVIQRKPLEEPVNAPFAM